MSAIDEKNIDKMYKIRAGPSAVERLLYSSKLIALFVFRLQHDERVEDLHVCTSRGERGALRDICLKIKMKDRERPLALFFEIKHKEKDDEFVILDNGKHYCSITKIKNIITSHKGCNNLCESSSNADYVFILYTNARIKSTNTIFKSKVIDTELLNAYTSILRLLNTARSSLGKRYTLQCSDNYVKDFAKDVLENDLTLLAKRFAMFISEEDNLSMNIMNDEFIQRYHVILKQKIVDLSHIETDKHSPELSWRTLTFREDFFTADDNYVVLFKDQLLKEIIKKQNKMFSQDLTLPEPAVDELISSFLSNPSAEKVIQLFINNVLCKKDNHLHFLIQRSPSDMKRLQLINISELDVEKAILLAETTATQYLQSLKCKVPIEFGNVDLVTRASKDKNASNVNYLKSMIVSLCQQYQQKKRYKIVMIDDSSPAIVDLASAVGNTLVHDEETNMLMFSNKFTAQQKYANILFFMLINEIDGIHEYRFEIKTTKFPKLHFNCIASARELLSKVIIYEKQSNHDEIENILINEIEEQRDRTIMLNCSTITSHSLFSYYHNEILMKLESRRRGELLNELDNVYKLAIEELVTEPQMSTLHVAFHNTYIRYFIYGFNENVTKWMELPTLPSRMFIVTETVALTTVKVIQCLRSHYSISNYAVLDFEGVLKLLSTDFNSLCAEIRKTKKVIIILCHFAQNNSDTESKLSKLTRTTGPEHFLIITRNSFLEKLQEYFPSTLSMFTDETQSLQDMTPRMQKEIIKHTKIIFQGQEVTLSSIIDNVSAAFVKGYVLDKIIQQEIMHVGTSLTNSSYEELKDFYIERRVAPYSKATKNTYDERHIVTTLLDMNDDGTVHVSAESGMGKSSLLTHLSLNTQKYYKKLWIVRVNFVDHLNQFNKWCGDGTVMDSVELLTFLCKIALNKQNISGRVKIINNEAHLVDYTGDEITAFGLKLFLHFYNQRRLIFVFDGFDEIRPNYRNNVVDFLKVAGTDLRKRKMWVTSRPCSIQHRPCSKAPPPLITLGKRYTLERLSLRDQEMFLKRFWKKKFIFDELNDTQSKNLLNFMNTAEQSIKKAQNCICRIYGIFYKIVFPNLNEVETGDCVPYACVYVDNRYSSRHVVGHTLSEIPLLLYYIAHCFVNIADIDENSSKSILEINMPNIYEMYRKSNFRKTLWQDKSKTNLSNPYIKNIFKERLDQFINTHRKLAAYVLLHNPIFKQLDFEEFKDMRPLHEGEINGMLNKVMTAGLVSHITADNVPVFIHRSFTEYFAADYICDILESDQFSLYQKALWLNAILECCNSDLIKCVHKRKEENERVLRICSEIKDKEPQILFKNLYRLYFDSGKLSKSQFIRLLSFAVKDCAYDYIEKYIVSANDAHDSLIYFHSVFVQIHEEILKRCMSLKPNQYHYKVDAVHKQAINNIKSEPQIIALYTIFYMRNIRYFGYSFSKSEIHSIKLPELPSKTLIVTEIVPLTAIKLIEHLRSHYSTNRYAVLELECIFNLTTTHLLDILYELEKTEKTLIIVWSNTNSSNERDMRIHELAHVTKHKQLVIITNDLSMETIKEHFHYTNNVFNDKTLCLTTMSPESQEDFTKEATLIFQGQEINLNSILDQNSIPFIKGSILDKMIRKETIHVGTSLSNSIYEDIKHLYIHRRLIPILKTDNNNTTGDDDATSGEFITARTFHDVDDDIVLLTAAPGMGKSTLLTHLSLNTKQSNTKLWIVRVNFLEHIKQFHKWHNEATVVDSVESLKFLCRVALGTEDMSFSIEIINDEARLVSCSCDELGTFKLNIFLHFYNNRRMIFIFDDFDDICLFYEDWVINLLCVTSTYLRKNKMWITSRNYSLLVQNLRNDLGKVFKINRFDDVEQKSFLESFWREKLRIEKFTQKQLKNFQAFIDIATHTVHKTSDWLCRIYCIFDDLFRPLLWQLQTGYREIATGTTMLSRFKNRLPSAEVHKLSGTPLLLHFMANYFVNMTDIGENSKESDLDIHLHNIYDKFLENKLKTILFRRTSSVALSSAIAERLLRNKFAECTQNYKKLAAYALFQDPIFLMLNFEEFENMRPLHEKEAHTLLNKIKSGADKTGLISHVSTDDVPVFIHTSFTEYFAAGYICDVLKNEKFNLLEKRLWYNTIEQVYNTSIIEWVDIKKMLDRELKDVLDKIKGKKPLILKHLFSKYRKSVKLSYGQYIRLISSSVEDYEEGFEQHIQRYLGRDLLQVENEQTHLEVLLADTINKMKLHLKTHFVEQSVEL